MSLFFPPVAIGDRFRFTSSPPVSGATLSEALSKWYLDNDTVQLVDTCHTVNCNVGCRASSKERAPGRDKGRPPTDEAELLASFKKYFELKL